MVGINSPLYNIMKKEIKKIIDWILYKQIPAWILLLVIIIWILI